MKTIERLIICVVLTTLAYAVCGCKEKAEAKDMQLIYTDDPIYDDPEPNEPEPSVIEFQCLCGCQYIVQGYDLCYSQKYSIITDIAEPNEPIPGSPYYKKAFDYHKWFNYLKESPEPNEPVKIPGIDYIYLSINELIPTWPDYIELEKDLIIDMEHLNTPTSQYSKYLIIKGTKIYFKEEQ